ncbi:hypothetical protein M0802_007338 [Mischocyttarus mexicanus]|nr:hypothetical protein M0802_007338 [Mischocyttarus mexicanus]
MGFRGPCPRTRSRNVPPGLSGLGQEVWMVNPSPVCPAADDSRVSSMAHARLNHAEMRMCWSKPQEGKKASSYTTAGAINQCCPSDGKTIRCCLHN